MGQKVHPIGYRLGYTKDWDAKWFAKGKQVKEYLQEDLKIRNYIERRLKNGGISRIAIERTGGNMQIIIYTSKPGMVIGSGGKEVKDLKEELSEYTGKKNIIIDVKEIRIPELDATLIANNIAQKIEQRVSHRRAMKRAVELAMRMGAKGIRVQCKGRLGGAEIARKEWYIQGRVPLQTLRADIDYAQQTAYTKAGTIGVKVWVYKGDILKQENTEE